MINMTSIFYEPCCEILKECEPKPMSANALMKAILVKYPELKWSGTQGPVRAMLLKASTLENCPIRQVPEVIPPQFFYSVQGISNKKMSVPVTVDASPEEIMEEAFIKSNTALRTELLKLVRKMDETAFEELVNQLISKMGFGRAETTPKTGDGGIDGYIYGDRLGLNVICIQAKRYDGHNVQRPDIQRFRGALNGRDGVFVTSADFSNTARQDAAQNSNGSKIALIDGEQLVGFMIEFNLGVQDVGKAYTLKRIDTDFFSEL